ncbi:hypothetical protein P167DRAFT_547194 [Morchella conica CCBAS932]|uniref:Uncharacterized protein n=1 Tax=Morchella conica CCBAS932 TaxID=1392247 RepID=A0A3N4KIG0_9PEZI|nr:hypothetical protein P167DRAFT_547194 [Morchella conica CCBAS932]
MPGSTIKRNQFYSAKDPAGKVSSLDLGSFETPKDTVGFPKTPISGEIASKPPSLSRSRREAELLRRSALRGELGSPTDLVHARRSARRLLFTDLQLQTPTFPALDQGAPAGQQEQKGDKDPAPISYGERNAGQHIPADYEEGEEKKPSSDF